MTLNDLSNFEDILNDGGAIYIYGPPPIKLERLHNWLEGHHERFVVCFDYDLPYHHPRFLYAPYTRNNLIKITDKLVFLKNIICAPQKIKLEIIKFIESSLYYAQKSSLARPETYENLYQNLQKNLERSSLANDLFGTMKNIPAIICGAGPSLANDIDNLREFHDKALIIAGGATITALSHYNYTPHLYLSADPSDVELQRLRRHNAFEIPLIYLPSVKPEILSCINAPRLYLCGADKNELKGFFERHINLANLPSWHSYSISSISLDIACHLGCNPIILAGVDMAFTNNKHYSGDLVSTIPEQKNSRWYETTKAKDIHGNPITSQWCWIMESDFLSSYIYKYPQTIFINATRGGIGVQGFPNVNLTELNLPQYDITNILHTNIQQTRKNISCPQENFQELYQGLKHTLSLCENMIEDVLNFNKPNLEQLQKEMIYPYLIQDCMEYFYNFLPRKSGYNANDLAITAQILCSIEELLQQHIETLTSSIEPEVLTSTIIPPSITSSYNNKYSPNN